MLGSLVLLKASVLCRRGHGGVLSGGGGGAGVPRGGVQCEGGDGEGAADGGDLRHEDGRAVEGRVRSRLLVTTTCVPIIRHGKLSDCYNTVTCIQPFCSSIDIEDLTRKTGNFKQFPIFCSMLESAVRKVKASLSG